MKQLVLCLAMVLAFCITNAIAQKTNLVGTTWKMSTCICDGTYNDWGEEGTITFLKNGRIKDSSGSWKLVGNTVKVVNFDKYQPEITAKMRGDQMTGEILMGMNLRLFKFRAVKIMDSDSNGEATQSRTTLKRRPPSVIRQIDFKNFTYQTLGDSGRNFSIQLRNGEYTKKVSRLESYGTHFDRVVYGDLTGDGEEEAIVVLVQEVSASSAEQYAYIYTVKNGSLSKLTKFVGGTSGCVFEGEECSILEVSIENGLLIIDRAIPTDQDAKCCPSLHRSTKYRWNGSQLVEVGKTQILRRPQS